MVGYDDSEASKHALERVADVADEGATVALVTAAEPLFSEPWAGQIDPREEERRDQALSNGWEFLAERGIEAITIPAVGDPAEAILEAAREADADLVVVSSSSPRLSAERGQRVRARLLAPAARLGAHTAMLMVLGVALALFSAVAARLHTRLEDRCHHRRLNLGLPTQDLAGRLADVGAIEVEADTARQLRYISLGEARVGASGAALCAGEALLDAACQRLRVGRGRRVRSKHFLDGHRIGTS